MKKTLLLGLALFSASLSAQTEKNKITPGIFQPTLESLSDQYKCPEWFRDAKFGIWAHWSAQCVPEEGDWYARGMYIQGDRYYDSHVRDYGHPSEWGFMEFNNLWKADKWDPEKLMELYKRAGAKYFVALANHHDNFDAYDSKYHEWNSVNVGPKKDIVGIWEKIARRNGLRFGVSNHAAHAWHWLQTAYGYDGEGPKQGVRYDAYHLTKEDGKGKWWEGLDPQKLYTGPNMVMPDGLTSIQEIKDWHEKNDRVWTEKAPVMNPDFTRTWYLRTQDLIQKYKPDLIYFDDFGLPLGQTGYDITADFYNANMKWHKGKLEAVVNAKEIKPNMLSALVADVERGSCTDIQPIPWQTCTCIGDWHYNKHTYEKGWYKSPGQVIRMLVDIVSKNGNLLLSIPMKGDGTIDHKEVAFLEEMSRWMEVNQEGIFKTRPWQIFGEGPTQVKTGMFSEKALNYTAEDIRFTTKGEELYAFVMIVPEKESVIIKNLSSTSELLHGNRITGVSLLGYTGSLTWEQTENGLEIKVPETMPCHHAITFKIKGALEL